MTNQQIIQTINALNAISNKEMPIELTYKVMDNLGRLLGAYEPYTKSLEKIKAKYSEGSEMFYSEAGKLLEIEVELDINYFTKDELLESGISLTPLDLISLQPLIKDNG